MSIAGCVFFMHNRYWCVIGREYSGMDVFINSKKFFKLTQMGAKKINLRRFEGIEYHQVFDNSV